MNIIESLTKLGLSGKEGEVYVALLRLGSATGGQLVKACGHSRGTTYFLANSLKNRGLISVIRRKRGIEFVPKSPHLLTDSIERELERVRKQLELANTVAQNLKALSESAQSHRASIETFDGASEIEGMLFSNADAWHQSIMATDSTWWGFEDHRIYENHAGWFQYIWGKYHSVRTRQIKVNVFINFKHAAELMAEFPITKLQPLPDHRELRSTVWVMGEFVVTILTGTSPQKAILIREKSLAADWRSVFAFMWKNRGQVSSSRR